MDICVVKPFPREKAPSLIEIKNKLRLGHDECCNCCCCKVPQFKAYRYVQPKVRKSFRPVRCYEKTDVPLDDHTTYKTSFWPGPAQIRQPIVPEGCLKVAEGNFDDETTHKLSYPGNWCNKPQKSIRPCKRNWFGRGPLQTETTQKRDFSWKCGGPQPMIKYRGNICLPRGCIKDDTTYKLSYYDAKCVEPIKSFRPVRKYEKLDAPLDDCTTYRLSFYDGEPIDREIHPWQTKIQYHPPTTRIDDHTTYNLSYWPYCQERVKPFLPPADDDTLKRGCCFDDKTTYNNSYFGTRVGDRPRPFVPPANKIFEDAPLDADTTNKLSYLGNWCHKPTKPIIPCARQLLGRGPLQDVTTQKRDFDWKCAVPPVGFKPEGNLALSGAPLEACTTNRLSYLPNCPDCLVPNKSFAPVREYVPIDAPMDLNTTAKLSYGYSDPRPTKIDKPWARGNKYHKPTTMIDDSTTYELSYIPPGTLEPCCPETKSECPPVPRCSASARTRYSQVDERPCISC